MNQKYSGVNFPFCSSLMFLSFPLATCIPPLPPFHPVHKFVMLDLSSSIFAANISSKFHDDYLLRKGNDGKARRASCSHHCHCRPPLKPTISVERVAFNDCHHWLRPFRLKHALFHSALCCHHGGSRSVYLLTLGIVVGLDRWLDFVLVPANFPALSD